MVCDLARNAMLLLGLVAAAAAQDGWSMFRGSTFRDGNTREVGPSGNGTLWRFLLRDRSFAPPSVRVSASRVSTVSMADSSVTKAFDKSSAIRTDAGGVRAVPTGLNNFRIARCTSHLAALLDLLAERGVADLLGHGFPVGD